MTPPFTKNNDTSSSMSIYVKMVGVDEHLGVFTMNLAASEAKHKYKTSEVPQLTCRLGTPTVRIMRMKLPRIVLFDVDLCGIFVANCASPIAQLPILDVFFELFSKKGS